MSIDKFHDHLDACKQCRENPHDLCASGGNLLVEAATALPQTGRIPSQPQPQNIPIHTDLGRQITEAFRGRSPLVTADYSTTELRVLKTLDDTPKRLVCADCGSETNTSMTKPCTTCGSFRVVLLSFVEQHFGLNWRDAFK